MSGVSLIDGHVDEPKMTDEQIIKVLSEFYDLNLLIEPNTNESITFGDVLDLINRKNAEIDYWKRNAFDGCMERGKIYKTAKSEAITEFTTEFEKRCIDGGIYPAFVKKQLNDVKKEMAGEKDV